jgi:CheY-like chemotaxis protein
MASSDAVLLLQTCAVACWGTAGSVALQGQERGRATTTLLGVGLLVGAILTAIDSEVAGGAGLPLASWSLLLFGMLALLPRDTALASTLCSNGMRLVVAGGLVLALLHWTHGAAAVRPSAVGLGIWEWLRLSTAALLGWLAVRCPHSNVQIRWLLGATAAGVGVSALLGNMGPVAKAVLQILAVVPMLATALQRDLAATTIAAATSLAFGFTGALRACAVQQGRGPQLAGLEDPLLVLAVVFGGFGIALHRAYRTMQAAPHGTNAVAAAPTTVDLAPAAAPMTVAQAGPTIVVAPIAAPRSATALAAAPAPAPLPAPNLAPAAASPQLSTSLADLEDFERLLQGTVALTDAPFDLHELLQRATAESQPNLRHAGPKLQLDLHPSLPRWIRGDAPRVGQLIARLLQLATAMDTGHTVQVRASADDTLHIVIHSPDWTMPARRRTLSLLFSQQLALTLGGELQLRSASDDALEIHLQLPNRAAAAPTAAATALHGHVLMVDDRSDLQRLLGHLLVQAGAQVTAAATAAQAQNLLAQEHFDLVLIDFDLPDRDGGALAHDLRRQGVRVPIVALTNGSAEARFRSQQAGCDTHVDRPIDFALLQQELARHLPPASA